MRTPIEGVETGIASVVAVQPDDYFKAFHIEATARQNDPAAAARLRMTILFRPFSINFWRLRFCSASVTPAISEDVDQYGPEHSRWGVSHLHHEDLDEFE